MRSPVESAPWHPSPGRPQPWCRLSPGAAISSSPPATSPCPSGEHLGWSNWFREDGKGCMGRSLFRRSLLQAPISSSSTRSWTSASTKTWCQVGSPHPPSGRLTAFRLFKEVTSPPIMFHVTLHRFKQHLAEKKPLKNICSAA